MLKPGLGKGLGELMDGDRVAGKERPPGAGALPYKVIGRGLNTLVSPVASDKATEVKDEAKAEVKQLLPPWFFFCADILLLGYTIAITLNEPRPFDLGTVLFCAVSIGLGCVLGVLGVISAME